MTVYVLGKISPINLRGKGATGTQKGRGWGRKKGEMLSRGRQRVEGTTPGKGEANLSYVPSFCPSIGRLRENQTEKEKLRGGGK